MDKHVGDVVEAVPGIIDGQPVARLHIDGQQIANRVAVFGAVEPMNSRAPRIWFGERGAVDRRFEKRGQGLRLCRLGTHARGDRRHVARLHLAENFLPDFRVCGNIGEAQTLE